MPDRVNAYKTLLKTRRRFAPEYHRFPARKMKRTLPFIILLAAAVFLPSRAAGEAQQHLVPVDENYSVGDKVSVTLLRKANNTPYSLKSGRVNVLFFWFDICDECVGMMKSLESHIRRRGLTGKVAVTAVTRGDTRDEINSTLRVARERKIPFDLAFDPDLVVSRNFSVRVAPSIVIIDRNNVLRTPPVLSVKEPQRKMDLLDFLDSVLAGRRIPAVEFLPPPEEPAFRRMLEKLAPDFSATTLAGKTIKLKNYRGRSLMLLFWHPNCKPCVAQMQGAQAFYDAHGKEYGFDVLPLAFLSGDRDRSKAGQIFADNGLTFPIAVDSEMAIGKKYNVKKAPVVFIIDPRGVVRDVKAEVIKNHERELGLIFRSLKSDG